MTWTGSVIYGQTRRFSNRPPASILRANGTRPPMPPRTAAPVRPTRPASVLLTFRPFGNPLSLYDAAHLEVAHPTANIKRH